MSMYYESEICVCFSMLTANDAMMREIFRSIILQIYFIRETHRGNSQTRAECVVEVSEISIAIHIMSLHQFLQITA